MPAGAAAPAEGLGDVVCDAADAEEDVHPPLMAMAKPFLMRWLKERPEWLLASGSPLKVDVLLKEGGHEAVRREGGGPP